MLVARPRPWPASAPRPGFGVAAGARLWGPHKAAGTFAADISIGSAAVHIAAGPRPVAVAEIAAADIVAADTVVVGTVVADIVVAAVVADTVAVAVDIVEAVAAAAVDIVAGVVAVAAFSVGIGIHIVASDSSLIRIASDFLIHIVAAESQLEIVKKLVLALASPLAQQYWMDIY